MKKIFILWLFAFSLALQGCDGFSAALQQATQGMGSTCMAWQVTPKKYNYSSGEYEDIPYGFKPRDADGNDVSNKEVSWLQGKMDSYSYAGNLGLFYDKSPYSDESYQFNVYCTEWQHQ